ncbi:hypothetical protein [Mailhella sp.]
MNILEVFNTDIRAKEKEEKLREYAQELINREQELTFREEALKNRETFLNCSMNELREKMRKVAADEANLLQKSIDLEKLQLQAESGFPLLLEEKLASAKNKLEEEKKAFLALFNSLEEEKKDLRKRKLEIEQAEAVRNAGYTEERRRLDEELAEKHSEAMKKLEEASSIFKQAENEKKELAMRAKALEVAESKRLAHEEEARVCLEKELAMKRQEGEDAIRSMMQEIEDSRSEMEKRKKALEEREKTVANAEHALDSDFEERKHAHEQTLLNRTQAVELELAQKKAEALSGLSKELEMFRLARLSALEKELADKTQEWEAQRNNEKKVLEEQKETLRKKEAELQLQHDELEDERQVLQTKKTHLDKKAKKLDTLEEEKLEELRQKVLDEKTQLEERLTAAREETKFYLEKLNSFDTLATALGGKDPSVALKELRDARTSLVQQQNAMEEERDNLLRQENAQIKSELNNALAESSKLRIELTVLRKNEQTLTELQDKNDALSSSNAYLELRVKQAETEMSQMEATLRRIQATYERESDYEQRVREIETPYFTEKPGPQGSGDGGAYTSSEIEINEQEWLKEIEDKSRECGMHFPRRILHAFHTALKVADWSPITVLAGVSGTGKSALPRYYAHFGGIKFLNLPVQPNWDCQESMLGFFNSIDNKFDAQPLLRILVQCQNTYRSYEPELHQEGLGNFVTLILLDEMNLSHVELYFADFLSKLEERRDAGKDNVPHIDVKLGTGVKPYKLKLYRNVLWAGTMNQDETTKSLSDKVLDRGIVINFPRPKTFLRRTMKEQLGAPRKLICMGHWMDWREKNITPFKEEEILPYKQFVEQINDALSSVGRALGHRVWQSIENYMTLYPDVITARAKGGNSNELRRAMRNAFEDQLVQKVMPKLRGIETRGKSRTDCLDKIYALLESENYPMTKDFKHACEHGYGQFIWNSATYLEESDSEPCSSSEGL